MNQCYDSTLDRVDKYLEFCTYYGKICSMFGVRAAVRSGKMVVRTTTLLWERMLGLQK